MQGRLSFTFCYSPSYLSPEFLRFLGWVWVWEALLDRSRKHFTAKTFRQWRWSGSWWLQTWKLIIQVIIMMEDHHHHHQHRHHHQCLIMMISIGGKVMSQAPVLATDICHAYIHTRIYTHSVLNIYTYMLFIYVFVLRCRRLHMIILMLLFPSFLIYFDFISFCLFCSEK